MPININVNESMAKLRKIRDNDKKINEMLQEIEQLFEFLEEPIQKTENKPKQDQINSIYYWALEIQRPDPSGV